MKCGQKILSFDRKVIANAGLSDVTAILIINTNEYEQVELIKTGAVETSEKIIILH